MKRNCREKIGIITIVDNNNYGNRLQNFAVAEVYRKLGFETDTLVLNQRKGSKKYILRAFRMLVTPFYQWLWLIFKDRQTLCRRRRFKGFNRENGLRFRYLPFWSNKLKREYRFFSVGSDQIWNSYQDLGYGTEFLTFAEREQRICFAPSFGVDSINPSKVQNFKTGLEGMPMLSVREESGAGLIRQLTGANAEILLDPTFMLPREEWEKIIRKPSLDRMEEPYLLEYFLAGEEEQLETELAAFADTHGLFRMKMLDKRNLQLYCTDPAEFLYLIQHADLVATDSFHAVVFSIIFDKPFLVFKRKNGEGMGDRIITLLKKLRLENKLGWKMDQDKIFEHEYSDSYEIIEKEKKKTICFLQRSVCGK